jgi:ribosome maturation factor RimP
MEFEELETTIESRLAALDPEVELVMLERPAAESLRLYVDRPGGVDLALCERITGALRDLLDRYSLEVSSPGLDRPLTKPAHFRRFLGHRVRVRTREPIDGQRSFTGTLVAADDRELSLREVDAERAIPLAAIRRSNLVPGSRSPEVAL